MRCRSDEMGGKRRREKYLYANENLLVMRTRYLSIIRTVSETSEIEGIFGLDSGSAFGRFVSSGISFIAFAFASAFPSGLTPRLIPGFGFPTRLDLEVDLTTGNPRGEGSFISWSARGGATIATVAVRLGFGFAMDSSSGDKASP